ncbi:hypothetical protein G3N28_23415 [Desulfobacter hydrogenophilus]|nr:hypothetical protein [Desulfobacter hydrogenophilus]
MEGITVEECIHLLSRVRFIQKEKFSGIAIPFISVSWSIEKGTVRSFGDMNNALKKKAEKVR